MSTTRSHGTQDSILDYGIVSFLLTMGVHGMQDSISDYKILS